MWRTVDDDSDKWNPPPRRGYDWNRWRKPTVTG